eukprot:CAMPEP_0204214806 /NCGR_PEP_ID=MMETSP0361-20130328/76978_1 /ASSEMBLY_ACC=CAM_ASM_000343 /TAXON_ID=268821 /ORGANISM="Scrippsiella Hangoei, Strain SHTV-5" /LENGTH=58 /DNA_ID=CAMNT_0051179471 /DNA_START=26 /DNA_END=199 /DNA_ORIENTATION=-
MACEILGKHGEAAAPHLAAVAKCLSDSGRGGEFVRAAACEALGKHGEAAEPHLGAIAE